MIITPATKLDAINNILGAIGESPVNTLENPTNVDVINAIHILDSINRQTQAKGWSFNTIDKYILNPDAFTGKIRWVDNFLFLKSADGNKYVKRGAYLYNLTQQTDIFQTAVEVECILLVDFEDMPEAMRQYITAQAASEFQVRYFGDAQLAQKLAGNVMEAWAALQEYELDLNDFSMLDLTGVQALRRR